MSSILTPEPPDEKPQEFQGKPDQCPASNPWMANIEAQIVSVDAPVVTQLEMDMIASHADITEFYKNNSWLRGVGKSDPNRILPVKEEWKQDLNCREAEHLAAR